MNMKQKKLLYTLLLAVGLCLVAAALVLRRFDLADNLYGMLVGVGAGLAAMGAANCLMLRVEERDPKVMRQSQIETTDERNVAIRRRAQAVSGEVLQWTVLAAAWLSIGLGAPLWITLAAVGVFVAKSVLEGFLMNRYQREM